MMDGCARIFFLCPDSLSHTMAFLLCIVFTAASHMLLKTGASSPGSTRLLLVNPWTASGLILLGLVTIMAVYAMQKIELKVYTAWTGLVYLIVPLAAGFILRERLSARRIIGPVLIVVGISVFQF